VPFDGVAAMSAEGIRRVLVGWDGSAGAGAALATAAAIADGEVGRVVALAVLRPVAHGESEEDRAAEMARDRRQAEESFGKARDTLPGASRARVTLKFAESSDPARSLCEYAGAHEFELLVLGRHGSGGMLRSRLQLGRVAETVTKKSGISLLLLGQS
jgi:nucleotide-binding universal stress UspA family protein